MTHALDTLLNQSAPPTGNDPRVIREITRLIGATEPRRPLTRRFSRRLLSGTVAAVTFGVGGVAVAQGALPVPQWITGFSSTDSPRGYDFHRSYTGPDGDVCHEAFLVSRYVRDKDPMPPSPTEVQQALAVARSVVAAHDFGTVTGPASRRDLMRLSATIDAALKERGLPNAYALGVMGDCATSGAR